MFPDCGPQSSYCGSAHLPCQWPDQSVNAEAILSQRQSHHLGDLRLVARQEPPCAEDQAIHPGLPHPARGVFPAGECHGGLVLEEKQFLCYKLSAFSTQPF